jgi:hypothetical protein
MHMAEPMDAERDPDWVYASVDVSAEHFGDAIGELNRTGWTITASRELDADELAALAVNGGQRRGTAGWMRVYAKRRF